MVKSKIFNVSKFRGCVKIVNGKQLMLNTDTGLPLELIIPDDICLVIHAAMNENTSRMYPIRG